MNQRMTIQTLLLVVVALIGCVAYLSQHLDFTLLLTLWLAEVPVGLLLPRVINDHVGLPEIVSEHGGDSTLSIAYASITQHLLALAYWTDEWKGSPDALPTWEEYKQQESSPPSSVIDGANKDWDRKRLHYDYMVAQVAIIRNLESAITKIRAIVLPDFEAKFPEVYKSIVTLSSQHIREESVSIFKSIGLPPSWVAGRKAQEELSYVMVEADRMRKLFPNNADVKSKAQVIKQVIDSMMDDIQKWEPKKGRIAY